MQEQLDEYFSDLLSKYLCSCRQGNGMGLRIYFGYDRKTEKK